MGNSKKRMRPKSQRILAAFMAMFMVVCAFWTSGGVVKAADPTELGAATKVDINFDMAKFEEILNPAFTCGEVDDYLQNLGDISNTPGVRVYANLGLEYKVVTETLFDDYSTWHTDAFKDGSVNNRAKLSNFYGSSFSEDTLAEIRKEASSNLEVCNTTYRLMLEVRGQGDGTINFTKDTPLTINGETYKANYVKVSSETNGYYYIDLEVHETTLTRVSDIEFSMELKTLEGYAAKDASYEREYTSILNPAKDDISKDFDAAYNIREGVEYTLNISVSHYGGTGAVNWDVYVYGMETLDGKKSYIESESFDGIRNTVGKIYIDPEDDIEILEVKLTSADDPTISKTIQIRTLDNSNHSVYLKNSDGVTSPQPRNYVDFDGKSRTVVQPIMAYDQLFGMSGEMNDKVVEVEISGNTKPVKWFTEARVPGHTVDIPHLFSIDPNETSKHLILTASLRAYPECKVVAHYFLSSKWVTIKYQLDSRYSSNYVDYKYPVGEAFTLVSGTEAVAQYMAKYPKSYSFDWVNETVSGWTINGTFYASGKPLTVDGSTEVMYASAKWIKNPIVVQPYGRLVDTSLTYKQVPVSDAIVLDSANLGNLDEIKVYLDKYNEDSLSWESTELSRTTSSGIFTQYPGRYLYTKPDSDGYFTIQAGAAPNIFAYGTYRYKIVTEDLIAFVSDPFTVDVKNIVINAEDCQLKCGEETTVTFVANDTSVSNTRYEWWFNNYNSEFGANVWTRVEDLDYDFNVTGHDSTTLRISAKDGDDDFRLMEGQVKCKFINADTDEVIFESNIATISPFGHSMTEAYNPNNSQDHHMIRCAKCHGISITEYPHHALRWFYSTSDSTKITWKCKDCGYIDTENENIAIPARGTESATITFNSNDGKFKQKTVNGKQYQTLDTKSYAFVDETNLGYTQIGWAFNAESKVPDYSMDDLAIMDNTYDLYAVWEKTENKLIMDLIDPNAYEFWYGGKAKLNESSSLFEDEDFLEHYFDGIFQLQWICRSKDGTKTVIKNSANAYKDDSITFPIDDPDGLYVGSYIQLRAIDGNRVFYSSEVAFDTNKKYLFRVHVVDGSGNDVTGASVSLIDKKTGEVVASGTTASRGGFACNNILNGRYIVRVTKDGFAVNEHEVELFKNITDDTVTMLPDAPVVTATTIQVAGGARYRIDSNWNKTGLFTGLYPNTEYKIYVEDMTGNVTEKVVKTTAPESYSAGTLIDSKAKKLPVDGFKFTHSCALESNLGLNFLVNKTLLSGYSNIRLYIERQVFSGTGSDYTLKQSVITSYAEESGKYKFAFKDFAAAEMCNLAYATLYAEKDGVTYISPLDVYSIRTYAEAALASSSPAFTKELKTAILAMLDYGAQAQVYFKRNTADMANCHITAKQRETYEYKGSREWNDITNTIAIKNPKASISSKALGLDTCIELKYYMTFDSTPTKDYFVKYSYTSMNGTYHEKKIPFSEFAYDSKKGKYYVRIGDIAVADLNAVVSAQIFNNGVAISETLEFNAESYAVLVNKQTNSSYDQLKKVMNAMMVYSRAAHDYFGQ